MVRKVLKSPNKRLNLKSSPVKDFGPKTQKLIRDLQDTMKALGGVGIAAPQIGVTKRLILVQAPKKPLYVMINPEITRTEGSLVDSMEGCLSVPGKAGLVKRYGEIQIKYQDENGEERQAIALDYEAKIVQHEIDHLNGILFPEVAETLWKA